MKIAPLLVGAGVFLLLRSGSKLDAVSKLKFDLSGFPAVRVESGRALLTLPITISNVTQESFSIKNIFARILVNGVFFGDVTSNQPFTIPALGSVPVSLSVSAFLGNAALALADAIIKKTGAVELALQGSVETTTVTVPLYVVKKI